VEEIVEALERLYSDTALRKGIGEAGAAWIVEEARTWSNHARQLKSLLLSL
jgi:glycosyltransferase involved in cell wall biosynthesis